MTSCVVRLVVVVVTTSVGCLDRVGRPSGSPLLLAAALPVDELRRFYLATGLTGRLACPFDEDPPDRLVVWTKDGQLLDAERGDDGRPPRVRLGRGGKLVFTAASTDDEGVYSCLIYSPLHQTSPESSPVQVLVRGK